MKLKGLGSTAWVLGLDVWVSLQDDLDRNVQDHLGSHWHSAQSGLGGSRDNLGGCQNYGPFLGSLNIRCRIIIGFKRNPKP